LGIGVPLNGKDVTLPPEPNVNVPENGFAEAMLEAGPDAVIPQINAQATICRLMGWRRFKCRA
jgi:hypothetical protein